MEMDKILMGGIAAMIGLAVIAGVAQAYTPSLDYFCPVCGEMFATYDELYQHFTTEHPAEPIDIVVAAFGYVSAIRQTVFDSEPGTPQNKKVLRVEIDVKNTSTVAGLCSIHGEVIWAGSDQNWFPFTWGGGLKQATILPGQTITMYDHSLCSAAYGYTCKVRVVGDPGITQEVPMVAS